MTTYPKYTDVVKGAIWRSIGLDHAKHAMQLPTNKEDNEKMVRIPKALKVGATALFYREKHHYAKTEGHYPTSNTGSSGKISREEGDDPLRSRFGCGVCHCKSAKVDHVRSNVHDGPEYNRPSRGFVEGDVFVEGNDVIERRTTEYRDEVATDWKENKYHIDMKNESGSASDCLEGVSGT